MISRLWQILCRRALAVAKEVNSRAHLHVSVNTFIPKPHTPFQWERQLSRGESQERLHLVKNLLKHKGIEIKWNPSDQSWLEGILARGDRRLAPVLMEAQRLGCRFDAWTEHVRIGNWQQAFSDCGIREDFYLRERREEELLPWDHIDVGVNQGILDWPNGAEPGRPFKLLIAGRRVALIAASAIGIEVQPHTYSSCQNLSNQPAQNISLPDSQSLVIACSILNWTRQNG